MSTSDYAFNMVNMSYYPTHMELGWGPRPETYPIEAYSLFDETGAQIEGVFLGNGEYTTWGVKLYVADSESLYPGSYWGLRLLVPGSNVPGKTDPLYPDEYRTFLKVTS